MNVNKENESNEKAHDDVGQDMQLIKKMLNEYIGEENVNEETVKNCTEAYQAYSEMGMEKEAAMQAAGNAMKLSKHMASKQAKEAKQSDEEMKKDEEKEESKEGEKMESKEAAALIAKLTGENTRLKESLRKTELSDMLDGKLAALKESRRVTDAIRKLVGEPKSEAHVDSVVTAFMSGLKESGETRSTETIDFAVFLEKGARTESKASGDDFTSFVK